MQSGRLSGELKTAPHVVACMPAYRAAEFIGPVLESLAAQTYANLSILISVDCCSDATFELCEAFAARCSNVRVIQQFRRQGWINNSNALLAVAKGDYIFFAFHDDPLAPNYVARLVEALEANPQAVLAFSDLLSTAGEPYTYDALDGLTDRFRRAQQVLHTTGNWWVPVRGLIRGSALAAVGGLRRNWAGEFSADWPWLLRLVLAGEFVHVREMLVSKRFHKETLSSSWRMRGWKSFAVLFDCLGIIRGARFPLRQELYLYCQVAAFRASIKTCPPLFRKLRDACAGRTVESHIA
jgi:glycosyltransferase involved in cell wall biosynthesis